MCAHMSHPKAKVIVGHSVTVYIFVPGNNSAAPVCQYGRKLNPAGECVCPVFSNCTESRGVCGSNGIEYRNECELKSAACQHKKHFVVFKKGMCGKLLFFCTIYFINLANLITSL